MSLDDYRVIEQLGKGGFGITYLVEAKSLPGKPKRVLKHLQPDSPPSPQQWLTLQRLFEKEAKMLAILGSHPQIPTLYDYLKEFGKFFLVQ